MLRARKSNFNRSSVTLRRHAACHAFPANMSCGMASSQGVLYVVTVAVTSADMPLYGGQDSDVPAYYPATGTEFQCS